MEIKVNHSELFNINALVEKDSEDLKKYIETLKSVCGELNLIWTSSESNTYCSKLNAYLDKIMAIANAYQSIGEAIKTSNINYQECDSNFAGVIRESVINNE